MASVLFDIPGPKAIVRHRILAVVTILVVAALLTFVILRLVESGQFTAEKWSLFTFPLVHERIIGAVGSTLTAFGIAAVLSLVLGFVLAIGRLSSRRWISVPCLVFTELFRAIPVLILMMIVYYGLPPLGVTWVTPLVAVVTGLTLYNGSVFAEIFRAGVQSLPKGQSEAAYAIGMSKGQVMRSILLPQAFRAMLPITLSQLVVVLKDTALGFIVTFQELLFLAKFYGGQLDYGSPIIPSTIVAGSIYIALCLVLAGIAKIIEVRTRADFAPRDRRKTKLVTSTGDAGSAGA